MMRQLLGGPAAIASLGTAAKGVAEVLTPSATRRMELSAEAQMAALSQLGHEYQMPSLGWFDRMVNGLNRLPRPFLAFGTIGLFFGFIIAVVSLITLGTWWSLLLVLSILFLTFCLLAGIALRD